MKPKTLKDALDLMVEIGYPVVAVFTSYDDPEQLLAITFSPDDNAQRIALSRPEDWEIWRRT